MALSWILKDGKMLINDGECGVGARQYVQRWKGVGEQTDQPAGLDFSWR